MRITINGKDETAREGTTVAALLAQLNLAPIRVAVEINEDLVPRRQFDDRMVQSGDRIEIVTFVGGG
jgi:thiamine biosynthesis protein ThiS